MACNSAVLPARVWRSAHGRDSRIGRTRRRVQRWLIPGRPSRHDRRLALARIRWTTGDAPLRRARRPRSCSARDSPPCTVGRPLPRRRLPSPEIARTACCDEVHRKHEGPLDYADRVEHEGLLRLAPPFDDQLLRARIAVRRVRDMEMTMKRLPTRVRVAVAATALAGGVLLGSAGPAIAQPATQSRVADAIRQNAGDPASSTGWHLPGHQVERDDGRDLVRLHDPREGGSIDVTPASEAAAANRWYVDQLREAAAAHRWYLDQTREAAAASRWYLDQLLTAQPSAHRGV
jgi:hypothetical protein